MIIFYNTFEEVIFHRTTKESSKAYNLLLQKYPYISQI